MGSRYDLMDADKAVLQHGCAEDPWRVANYTANDDGNDYGFGIGTGAPPLGHQHLGNVAPRLNICR